MIVQENRHLEAAIALLGNKRHAKALLQALEERDKSSYNFVVRDKKQVQESMLLLHNAGATTSCLVTPPKDPTQCRRITSLIEDGIQSLQGRNSTLAQTILGVDQPLLAEAFEHAGFTKLAILTTMDRLKSARLSKSTTNKLTFIPTSDVSETQIQTALQETYIDSLDCPKIHGLRHIRDIVEGHRGQGDHNAQLWTIAKLGDTTAGILLLNPVPNAGCMELAYLGTAPSARGIGVGDALVQLAIKQSQEYGLPKLTLAVDSENTPALRLYKRWNFLSIRQRLTMIRKLC